MDEIDIAISMTLMVNSRIPYQKLAEIFKMSVNSIHKRIKSMVNSGIIRKFTTQISALFFNLNSVVMFGISKAKNLDNVRQKLGNHENIYCVSQASNKLLYILAWIRNLNELDNLVSFVRQTGEINEINVGLDIDSALSELEDLSDISISKLDFLIINALKDNSRKTISDISYEVGASTKTVRRHLNHLIEKKIVDFSIHWYPDKSHDVISYIILKLNPNANVDKMKLIEKLRVRHGQKILFPWMFSNLPNLMIILVWTRAMKELQELEASLLSENFESINVTVLYNGEIFPTWRDKYLEEKIKEFSDNSN